MAASGMSAAEKVILGIGAIGLFPLARLGSALAVSRGFNSWLGYAAGFIIGVVALIQSSILFSEHEPRSADEAVLSRKIRIQAAGAYTLLVWGA